MSPTSADRTLTSILSLPFHSKPTSPRPSPDPSFLSSVLTARAPSNLLLTFPQKPKPPPRWWRLPSPSPPQYFPPHISSSIEASQQPPRFRDSSLHRLPLPPSPAPLFFISSRSSQRPLLEATDAWALLLLLWITGVLLSSALFLRRRFGLGMNAMDLRRGITMAVDAVVTNLKSRARMISTSEEIAQVGTISADGEQEIGELIAKAMEKVGKGVITIAYGKTLYKKLEDPLILIHEKKISSINAVVKALEVALTRQRPLLIIAEVESDAQATLILNKLRAGIKVCAIKAAGFGENMEGCLHDLSVLTGGQLITEELGLNPDKVELEMLVSCKKVTISKDHIVILDGAGDTKSIGERCDLIRSSD